MDLTMARKPFDPFKVEAPPTGGMLVPPGPLTVSQVTALIRQAIETSLPPTLHVVGEVSNFKRHGSGHLYFTLKDAHTELSCVMWRSDAARMKFEAADGLAVVATGAVEVFERAGRYQLYVRRLEPRGVGALELAFRQLCERLAREGLFEERHKKPLPVHPRRIAVVTSLTGAAISDILRTLQRRFPAVEVVVVATRVQGPGAAEEIARAIHLVNAHSAALGGVDVMIVGRGGGSLEDLWAFNEEPVARAVHASRIPIISAVGHEMDVTVSDLVADVRAATPTAAAELAVPMLQNLLEDLSQSRSRLSRAIIARASLGAARLDALAQRSALLEPVAFVRRRAQLLDELSGRIGRRVSQRGHAARLRLDRCGPIVRRIAPHAFFARTAIRLRDARHRLERGIGRRTADADKTLARRSQRLDRASPEHRLGLVRQRLLREEEGLARTLRHRLECAVGHVRRQEELLHALSYRRVLARGFSISRLKKNRHLLRSVSQLRDGDRVVTELAEGSFDSYVVPHNQNGLFD